MSTYTQHDLAKARAHRDVTKNGIAYDWWLANSDGAGFALYREPQHTDTDIQEAKRHLKNDQDVVGAIRVYTPETPPCSDS